LSTKKFREDTIPYLNHGRSNIKISKFDGFLNCAGEREGEEECFPVFRVVMFFGG